VARSLHKALAGRVRRGTLAPSQRTEDEVAYGLCTRADRFERTLTIAYTQLLHGCAQHGDGALAAEAWRALVGADADLLTPDHGLLETALYALRHYGPVDPPAAAQLAQDVLDRVAERNFLLSVKVANCAMSVFAKAGDADRATTLLRRLLVEESLDHEAAAESVEESLDADADAAASATDRRSALMRRYRASHAPTLSTPDVFTYAMTMTALKRAKRPVEGIEVYRRLRSSDPAKAGNVVTASAAAACCADAGDGATALEVVAATRRKDTVCLGLALVACEKGADLESGRALLQVFLDEGGGRLVPKAAPIALDAAFRVAAKCGDADAARRLLAALPQGKQKTRYRMAVDRAVRGAGRAGEEVAGAADDGPRGRPRRLGEAGASGRRTYVLRGAGGDGDGR